MLTLRSLAARLGLRAPAATPSPRPSEPANLSANLNAARLQAAIRQAETGDTGNLFALYRDVAYDNHVQAELQKRKLAVLNQPWTILPNDEAHPADVAAAEAVDTMVSRTANWSDGLAHLLDATVWPLAIVEKIYRPGSSGLRYELDRLVAVNPVVLAFAPRRVGGPAAVAPPGWEPDLRLFPVDPATGAVRRDSNAAQPLDPLRHLVHRGHLMTGQRDYFGGPMRGILSWVLLRGLSREWFAQAMERYGSPFILGRGDVAAAEAVAFLQEQFAAASKIRGLVVDDGWQIELKEIALAGLADAHERFAQLCNREISLLIVGQTLSAQAQPTGLGSGTADLQGDVRADLRAWDMLRLAETLREQLFRPFLEINGLVGEPPRITWGGDDPAARIGLADMLVKLAQAGLEAADESIPLLSEKVGFAIQRKAALPAPGFSLPATFAAGAPDSSPARTFAAPPRAGLEAGAPQAGIATALGVPAGWLNPVADFIAELEKAAADESLSDADLLAFLEKAAGRVPELFGKMDVGELAAVMEASLGQAVMQGVRQRIKPRA